VERDVSPHAAEALVAEGATLVDVREPVELETEGRFPGAVHIPLGELSQRAGELEGRRLVLACRTGSRSAMAAEALRAAGWEAYNLDGGIQAWERDGLSVERNT
jgi:rhodanese-related sulfurtransferase